MTSNGPVGTATRIRMITYFVDTTLDPANPRLMRQVERRRAATPSASTCRRCASPTTSPTASSTRRRARMVAADLTGTGGACAPATCSANQIRKVNVVLAMRSASRRPAISGDYYRNTLFTQVSLRSLAFVDQYP